MLLKQTKRDKKIISNVISEQEVSMSTKMDTSFDFKIKLEKICF